MKKGKEEMEEGREGERKEGSSLAKSGQEAS